MDPLKKLFETTYFSELQKKRKELDVYQSLLSEFLPFSLNQSFKVTKFFQGVLYLSTSSNVLAHKFKLISKDIIQSANKKLNSSDEISSIKIKIKVGSKVQKRSDNIASKNKINA